MKTKTNYAPGNQWVPSVLDLHDTPDSYLGQAGKVLGVSPLENALEFISVAGKPTPTVLVAASNAKTTSGADYVCDGVDDQNEINEAIASLGATGGIVRLSEGTFYITSSINLSSNVTIEGAGAGTELMIPDALNVDLSMFTASDSTKIRITNLQANVNSSGNTGYQTFFDISNSKNILVKNCFVNDFDFAFNLRGGMCTVSILCNKLETPQYCRVVTVRETANGSVVLFNDNAVILKYTGTYSFVAHFFGTSTDYLKNCKMIFKGNIINAVNVNHSYGLIRYEYSTNFHLISLGNLVYGNNRDFIYVSDFSQGIIECVGNFIVNCYVTARRVSGSRFVGNYVSSGYTCFNIFDSNQVSICNNYLYAYINGGVRLTSCKFVTVASNTIKRANTVGIYITDSDDVNVVGNTLRQFVDSPGWGQQGIIVTGNSNRCIIKGNTVSENQYQGIFINATGSDHVVDGNIVYSNSYGNYNVYEGIRISKGNNIIITNNRSFGTDQKYGINISSSDVFDAICQLNNCKGNVTGGINDSGTNTQLGASTSNNNVV